MLAYGCVHVDKKAHSNYLKKLHIRKMPHIPYLKRQDHELLFDGVPLKQVAEHYGTPCYVYSESAMCDAFMAYQQAFAGIPHLICYAMKANSNLSVLSLMHTLGAGFDIVSGGELARVQAAGGDVGKVIFSGVGKTVNEMEQALHAGIKGFNVESAPELLRLNDVAMRLGKVAPISFRVNPDVDPQTHPYISTGLKANKFGIAYRDTLALYRQAAQLPGIRLIGIECHIGSQITTLAPYEEALCKLLQVVDTLAQEGICLEHVDLGGGIGISYTDEEPVDLSAYATMVKKHFAGRNLKLYLEP
ncbi:MAG: diaminopimelate decarboxylase, partial [Pseudomonadota bacterium]